MRRTVVPGFTAWYDSTNAYKYQLASVPLTNFRPQGLNPDDCDRAMQLEPVGGMDLQSRRKQYPVRALLTVSALSVMLMGCQSASRVGGHVAQGRAVHGWASISPP